VLIATSKTDKYNKSLAPSFGFSSTGVVDTPNLFVINASSHWSFHLNLSTFQSSFRISRIFSINLGKKWDNEVHGLIKHCPSFKFFGLLIDNTATHLLGFTSLSL